VDQAERIHRIATLSKDIVCHQINKLGNYATNWRRKLLDGYKWCSTGWVWFVNVIKKQRENAHKKCLLMKTMLIE
jgi:hypothetical protein